MNYVKSSYSLVFVLTKASASLLMDLMNFEKTTKRTAFTRPKSVCVSLEKAIALLETAATLCIEKRIKEEKNGRTKF